MLSETTSLDKYNQGVGSSKIVTSQLDSLFV